jgi:hypothetical protein
MISNRKIPPTRRILRVKARYGLLDWQPVNLDEIPQRVLMSIPDASTYLATYGDMPVSLTTLAQVVFDLNLPRGHLPLDLPGVYPSGRGLTTFDAGN